MQMTTIRSLSFTEMLAIVRAILHRDLEKKIESNSQRSLKQSGKSPEGD